MAHVEAASGGLRAQLHRLGAPATTLFALTPSAEPCGVETFTRVLLGALAGREPARGYAMLPLTGRWRDLPRLTGAAAYCRHIVFNFPLVAWKRMILAPLLLLGAAAMSRRRTTVILHEWTSLHWLRRLALVPFVRLCDALVILSPYVAEQIAHDPMVRSAASKCRLLPHPPTIRRPDTLRTTDLVRQIERAAQDHDIVIGCFGSIYKGKASARLLEVGEHLHRRGVRALIVFAGGFIGSLDDYEGAFRAGLRERSLEGHVIVTGFVADEAELFALFERIDVFLFQFPEGLTARRSSVIACLQSDRPVVVSAPRSPDEFAHHTGFTSAIAAGALSFVSPAATVTEICDRVLAAVGQGADRTGCFDGEAWWNETLEAARALF